MKVFELAFFLHQHWMDWRYLVQTSRKLTWTLLLRKDKGMVPSWLWIGSACRETCILDDGTFTWFTNQRKTIISWEAVRWIFSRIVSPGTACKLKISFCPGCTHFLQYGQNPSEQHILFLYDCTMHKSGSGNSLKSKLWSYFRSLHREILANACTCMPEH